MCTPRPDEVRNNETLMTAGQCSRGFGCCGAPVFVTSSVRPYSLSSEAFSSLKIDQCLVGLSSGRVAQGPLCRTVMVVSHGLKIHPKKGPSTPYGRLRSLDFSCISILKRSSYIPISLQGDIELDVDLRLRSTYII